MTMECDSGNVLSMAKRTGKPIPREGTTPTEYKLALAQRIKSRREQLDLSLSYVAAELSRACGREIRADSYRKWETIESIVQVDAILPLCDILRIHVYELLDKKAIIVSEVLRPPARGKAVA
jgi:hypothetical protein